MNIRIALKTAVEAGVLPAEQEDSLLAAVAPDVTTDVLADNIAQNRVLAVTEVAAPHQITAFIRLLDRLEATGRVQRHLDALPSTEELRVRANRGESLCSPELALLLAHLKSDLTAELAASDLLTAPVVASAVEQYFPTRLCNLAGQTLHSHPLARQIAATRIANLVVNQAGLTFVTRMTDDTGRTASDAVAAYLAATHIYDLDDLWALVRRRCAPAGRGRRTPPLRR